MKPKSTNMSHPTKEFGNMKLDDQKIKFKVQPCFEFMIDYLLTINSTFPNITFIIQNGRNDVRMHNINGFRLVVKSFKGMYWPNRFAYSIFKKSKAQRSFETSIRLKSMGFHVPTAVAYIDYYAWGILQASYFISLYQDHEDLQTALFRYSSTHNLSNLFAGFIFQLHKAGVYHHDFSKGNILCVTQKDRIYFSMVDLNRVRFRSICYHDGLKSLSRLGIEQFHLDEVVMTYSQLWGRSFGEALKFIKIVQYARGRFHIIRLFLKRLFFPSRNYRRIM